MLATASLRQRSGSRLAAVLVMLSLWLGAYALEVSPELHHLLHEDSHEAGHNCLITQLHHQLLLAGFVAPLTPVAPTVWSAPARSGDFQFLPSRDYRLSPSRAPPTS